MIDYEISSRRVSAINVLWTAVEDLRLTDRADCRKPSKTKAYQLLGMELHDYIRNHSAEDIAHLYRIMGRLLVRFDEACRAQDPTPLQEIMSDVIAKEIFPGLEPQ